MLKIYDKHNHENLIHSTGSYSQKFYNLFKEDGSKLEFSETNFKTYNTYSPNNTDTNISSKKFNDASYMSLKAETPNGVFSFESYSIKSVNNNTMLSPISSVDYGRPTFSVDNMNELFNFGNFLDDMYNSVPEGTFNDEENKIFDDMFSLVGTLQTYSSAASYAGGNHGSSKPIYGNLNDPLMVGHFTDNKNHPNHIPEIGNVVKDNIFINTPGDSRHTPGTPNNGTLFKDNIFINTPGVYDTKPAHGNIYDHNTFVNMPGTHFKPNGSSHNIFTDNTVINMGNNQPAAIAIDDDEDDEADSSLHNIMNGRSKNSNDDIDTDVAKHGIGSLTTISYRRNSSTRGLMDLDRLLSRENSLDTINTLVNNFKKLLSNHNLINTSNYNKYNNSLSLLNYLPDMWSILFSNHSSSRRSGGYFF